MKFAKQIMAHPKYQEHGETLAMKGLTLNGLGRKEEAYDYVRRGLKNDLKSHVCWHVYGLLQRGDKKYDEAIKCYRNALRWEKDNIQILRDLSLLQIQMRDLEGYRETRHQLFKLRPSQHASWIGFAMSYHLLGDHETANNILDTFRLSQTHNETFDYKHSELLLYQNQILAEAGQLERALKHLDEFSAQIVDKLAIKEAKAELLIKLDRHEEAVPIYQALIKLNPENIGYFRKYVEARRALDNEQLQLDIYRDFQVEYPQSISPKRLPLDVANADLDQFSALADQYLRRGLRKGVPPLFVNLRALYEVPAKVAVIERLIVDYYENLSTNGFFTAADYEAAKASGGAEKVREAKEPASALLWTMYYMAQHYDQLRDSERALDFIEKAAKHTPTLIEVFVTKGRIYKHAGDLSVAAEWLDEAQLLDTADRYINSKCAKYMLRANMVQQAEEVCARFTREGVSAMENLNEMQCMWFQTECALAWQRQERWGDALKKCHEVDRHFAEVIEDQFDFHTYCMRKMTLRAYVSLLRLEDVLRRHPFYFKAAKCAIEVYLQLFDHPLPEEAAQVASDDHVLSASELKKLKNKQRKAAKKAEMETAQQAQAQVKKEQHNKSRQQPQQQQADGDPEAPQLDELIPDKLARPEDALEKATEFLRPLQLLAHERIETHLMAFEIYFRKRKSLLMLQSLKRAWRLDANSARLHECLMRFRVLVEGAEMQQTMSEAVKQVLAGAAQKVFNFGGQSPKQWNEAFMQLNGQSLAHVWAGAQVMAVLEPTRKAEAVRLVIGFDVKDLRLEVSLLTIN